MRKQYGQSRIDKCPFCEKAAVVKNSQGVPVCARHKKGELKCQKFSIQSVIGGIKPIFIHDMESF